MRGVQKSGPPKGMNKEIRYLFFICSEHVRVLKRVFLAFPGILEGLGSSGGLVGTISTYPGTYKCPGSRVMTKNPEGLFDLPVVQQLELLGVKHRFYLQKTHTHT